MSSVSMIKGSFRRSGSTITGDVTFKVSFSESENRLNLGFVATVVVTPSIASTSGIITHTDSGTGSVYYLSDARKEVTCPLNAVVKGGGSQSFTGSITVDVNSLFADYAWCWDQAQNQGLDVVRVEVMPEISASSADGPADQQFSASGALEFNGTDTYVEVNTPLPFTSRATIEMWIRGVPREAFLFYATDDSHRRQFSASVPWSDGNVYFDGAADASNNFNRIVKALSPLDDQRTWNHWAFIYDQPAAQMSIYKNGVRWFAQQGKATRLMAPCNRLVIGADGDAKGHFAGAICEVRLWSVTRTSAQIRENMVRRISGADDGLIASYALDQFVRAGESIPDRSGGGRNGVLRGTTVWALKPAALL